MALKKQEALLFVLDSLKFDWYGTYILLIQNLLHTSKYCERNTSCN